MTNGGAKSLHGVESAKVEEQRVMIEGNEGRAYQVDVLMTFGMDE